MSVTVIRRLACNFCGKSVTDEFSSEEDARKIMSRYGWGLKTVENGSKWDQCPDCAVKHEDFDQARATEDQLEKWVTYNVLYQGEWYEAVYREDKMLQFKGVQVEPYQKFELVAHRTNRWL